MAILALRSILGRISPFAMIVLTLAAGPIRSNPGASVPASSGKPILADSPAATAQVVVKEADPAPPEVGGTYARIVSESIDSSAAVSFTADIAGSAISSGLFLISGGSTQVLLKSGDAAPNGDTFVRFMEVDRSVATPLALLVFHAMLAGGPSEEGMFLMNPDGTVRALALADAPLPGGQMFRSFSNPSVRTLNVNGKAGYDFACLGQDKLGRQSFLWGESSDSSTDSGSLVPMAGPGPITAPHGGTGTVLSVTSISMISFANAACSLRVRTSGGAVRDEVWEFGNAGIYAGLRTGLRVRAVESKIKSIVGPPAIALQDLAATVRFKSGETGFVLNNLGADLVIYAKTGDAAPGLPGVSLGEFGPMVANPDVISFGNTPPRGYVAPVGLGSSGQGLFVLTEAADFPPMVSVSLVRPDQLQVSGSPVQNVSAIKLTDQGMLLMTGTVGSGDSSHLVVLTLSGLIPQSR